MEVGHFHADRQEISNFENSTSLVVYLMPGYEFLPRKKILQGKALYMTVTLNIEAKLKSYKSLVITSTIPMEFLPNYHSEPIQLHFIK